MGYDGFMFEAIKRTLCYSQVFDFPLTAIEIHQRLIGKKASLKEVVFSLKQHRVKNKNNFYYLSSTAIITNRLKNNLFSQQKLTQAYSLAKIISKINTIEAIFVTGAVAVGNASKKDDIDLCIITKKDKLWSTRLLINFALDILGKRRKPGSNNNNNKFCLNMWLTTDSLRVVKEARTLYSAYEVIQAKPIYDRGDIYSRFLAENKWVKKLLPNTKIPTQKAVNLKQKKIGIIEKIVFKLQKNYMRSKMTREKVSLQNAFFHPRNTADIVSKKYEIILRKYI